MGGAGRSIKNHAAPGRITTIPLGIGGESAAHGSALSSPQYSACTERGNSAHQRVLFRSGDRDGALRA